MAIVIRYMYCLVFISRSSDIIQYGGIVTKANNFQLPRQGLWRAKNETARLGCLTVHARFTICGDTCPLSIKFHQVYYFSSTLQARFHTKKTVEKIQAQC